MTGIESNCELKQASSTQVSPDLQDVKAHNYKLFDSLSAVEVDIIPMISWFLSKVRLEFISGIECEQSQSTYDEDSPVGLLVIDFSEAFQNLHP